MGIVYRNPALEHVPIPLGYSQDVREENGVPNAPPLVIFSLAFYEPALDDPVLKTVKPYLDMIPPAFQGGAVKPLALFRGLLAADGPGSPVAVEPLEVDRVERVVHALKPVGGEHDLFNFPRDVSPNQYVPAW